MNEANEALSRLVAALPPDVQDTITRDIVNSVGPKKAAQRMMQAVLTNAPPYQEAVADMRARGEKGEQLLEHTRSFIADLRDESGKDFYECWTAMNLILALATNPHTVVEMLGYALTWITFNGQVPPTPDTPESAAEKFKAARKVADEFIDLAKLADEMRNEPL